MRGDQGTSCNVLALSVHPVPLSRPLPPPPQVHLSCRGLPVSDVEVSLSSPGPRPLSSHPTRLHFEQVWESHAPQPPTVTVVCTPTLLPSTLHITLSATYTTHDGQPPSHPHTLTSPAVPPSSFLQATQPAVRAPCFCHCPCSARRVPPAKLPHTRSPSTLTTQPSASTPSSLTFDLPRGRGLRMRWALPCWPVLG